MKKIYLFLGAVFFGASAFSQCTVTVTGSTNVSCFGGCNGSATVTTVGTPTFTYSWSPGGQTIQNPTNLCAGTHTVTMTDASSCVATATVTITQPNQLMDSTQQVNATCNGDCDGSIDLFPYGGTTPYTYSWAPNGETTQDISSLCPGTYTVTITDGNNCTAEDSVTITEPAVLAVGVTGMMGCGTACDKSGMASPTGGTSPYTYAWSPGGQTTQTATGLCAGTFQVDVTDDNGCTATGVVTITNPTVLSVTTNATDASCGTCTDGSASATPAGGTAPFTYSWSPGGCTAATCTGLGTGVYTVTVTDANGCTATATDTVSAPSGLNESVLAEGFVFYPNPAADFIRIKTNPGGLNTVTISLINLLGETLFSETVETHEINKIISVSSLSSGIYFLNLKTDGKSYTEKFIKK